jgi:hypothetical protein
MRAAIRLPSLRRASDPPSIKLLETFADQAEHLAVVGNYRSLGPFGKSRETR